MMKQSILKNVKRNLGKVTFCLMMAGLSTFSVGFTNNDTGIEVEKVKAIPEVQVDGYTVAGKDTFIKIAEFVNITREAAETSSEESIQPINKIEGVENLTYNNNIEEENLSVEEGFSYRAVMSMEATAYLPTDGDGAGITAMGIPATYGVVAVDPGIIPLGSRVYIPGYGEAIAADTGGAIYGYRIDLCMESYAEAMDFGRRIVTVYLLD
jgi:3D (Asp-Asp-Asp) domain-containing protein